MELHDRRTYYRAFQSHDARFDGRVFVGVTSTGIYCRPICPARPPKFENCRFFASAAAAQEAGFRPCLRCRPEIAPDLAFWRGTANTVSRALALIADGALDGEHSDVEALAGRLGVGGRQLRRMFQRHLGASPIAVAQTRRVLFAKQLLHETPGTEWIDKDVWHRSIDLEGKRSSVAVAHFPERNSVLVTIHFPSVKALPTI